MSTNDTIDFTNLNGTYHFTVGPVAGYSAKPNSGSVMVNGMNVTQPIGFGTTGFRGPTELGSIGLLVGLLGLALLGFVFGIWLRRTTTP